MNNPMDAKIEHININSIMTALGSVQLIHGIHYGLINAAFNAFNTANSTFF
jgi:hypothetical protein